MYATSAYQQARGSAVVFDVCAQMFKNGFCCHCFCAGQLRESLGPSKDSRQVNRPADSVRRIDQKYGQEDSAKRRELMNRLNESGRRCSQKTKLEDPVRRRLDQKIRPEDSTRRLEKKPLEENGPGGL